MKVTVDGLNTPEARAKLDAGGDVLVVGDDGRIQMVVSRGRDAIEEPPSAAEVRYREALEKIAADAQRCDDCGDDTPEGVAPLATHSTSFWGIPQFLCDHHADYARESFRRARSKGCGEQPDVVAYAQPLHAMIALAALEAKP